MLPSQPRYNPMAAQPSLPSLLGTAGGTYNCFRKHIIPREAPRALQVQLDWWHSLCFTDPSLSQGVQLPAQRCPTRQVQSKTPHVLVCSVQASQEIDNPLKSLLCVSQCTGTHLQMKSQHQLRDLIIPRTVGYTAASLASVPTRCLTLLQL